MSITTEYILSYSSLEFIAAFTLREKTGDFFEITLKKEYTPQDIYFFGESAGANLVLSTTLYLKDHYLPVPGAVCAFSPSTNYDTGFESRITRANRDPMIG